MDVDSSSELGATAWEGKRWELRSALRAARRARETSRRTGRDPAENLIQAGQWLAIAGDGDGSFTVKQLADQAGVALQTFYRHFGSKDELILAVLEENVADGVRDMEVIAAGVSDPVERLRELIQLPIRMSAEPDAFRRLRFHARERQRLAVLYPGDVEAVFVPYRQLIERHIADVERVDGYVAADPAHDADVVMRMVAVYTHAIGMGALPWTVDECADVLWEFCRAALWRAPAQ